jgi:hypothetical protein
VTTLFQGADVGSANVVLDSNKTVSVSATVYNEVIDVKDVLGSPLAGASVVLQGSHGNATSVSDSAGSVTFRVVADTQYGLSVSVDGATYYTGTINTSLNDATFQVKTSYLPSSIELPVISVVVIGLLVVSVAFYIIRRRREGFERL